MSASLPSALPRAFTTPGGSSSTPARWGHTNACQSGVCRRHPQCLLLLPLLLPVVSGSIGFRHQSTAGYQSQMQQQVRLDDAVSTLGCWQESWPCGCQLAMWLPAGHTCVADLPVAAYVVVLPDGCWVAWHCCQHGCNILHMGQRHQLHTRGGDAHRAVPARHQQQQQAVGSLLGVYAIRPAIQPCCTCSRCWR
jgi:hypothetical protein